MAARPPLNAIFVFCEAARCGSFKLAAQQLCVTPGAVSRQIRALEDYLGHALFDRSPHAMKITRKGQALYDRVAHKMASIQSEVDLMRGGGRKVAIRVDVGVTFAMHWLIPRLSLFAEAHPDTQVQLGTTDGPIDLARPADVFICRDPVELRGLEARVFLEEYSVLVASPRLAGGKSSFTARELAHLPRIGARSRPDLWQQWSARQGLEEARYRPTLEFDNTVLAIQATSEGLGVMVVPTLFVDGMLDSGLLTTLESARLRTGCYSFATSGRRDSRRVAAFTDWLEEAGRR